MANRYASTLPRSPSQTPSSTETNSDLMWHSRHSKTGSSVADPCSSVFWSRQKTAALSASLNPTLRRSPDAAASVPRPDCRSSGRWRNLRCKVEYPRRRALFATTILSTQAVATSISRPCSIALQLRAHCWLARLVEGRDTLRKARA